MQALVFIDTLDNHKTKMKITKVVKKTSIKRKLNSLSTELKEKTLQFEKNSYGRLKF